MGKLHQCPKFYINVFFFVGLTTLETLVNFDYLFHLVECSNVSTTNLITRRGNFCIIIGDVQLFINLSAIYLLKTIGYIGFCKKSARKSHDNFGTSLKSKSKGLYRV